MEVPGYRRAAVLAALLDRPSGPTLLFTRRAAALPHHAGEISFPGGGLLPGEGPEEGALREAAGGGGARRRAPPSCSAAWTTWSPMARFVVTPVVVAVAAPPAAFTPAPGEVDEAFELPLARLLDPALRRATLWDPARFPPEVAAAIREANVQLEDVDAATGHWRIWSFHADEARVVWGLTGRVLATLLRSLLRGGVRRARVPRPPPGPSLRAGRPRAAPRRR